MRRLLTLAVLVPTSAAAAPVVVEGVVTGASSHWTSDGSRIVTEATVRTPDGDVVVSQLGGSVDGLTMRTFSMGQPEPVMVPGMRVAVEVREAADLSRRMHLVVEGLRVLAEPPGFVRTGPTKAGNYLYWESGCVFITVDAEGTRQVPGDQEFTVIDQVIATWNDGIRSCSYLQIKRDADEAVEVGRDMTNVIKFRDTTWCRPAVRNDPPRCYAESAAGLTTAVFVDDASSERDGAIVDADIELNGKNFAIAVDGMTLGDANCRSDLANTLTHELGHLLGLEHPCRTPADPPRIDGNGDPVPSCASTTDPEITEATMYNFQDCDETKKATLTQDDINGVCAIYPTSDDPGTCAPVGETTGCCSASGRTPYPAFLLAGMTVLLLGRRRRT